MHHQQRWQQWRLQEHVLALLRAAHQATRVEVEVEDAAELLRAEEGEGEVEAAVVALEAPHGQAIIVQPAATRVQRQMEVNLMVLSVFCYVTIVTKIYRRIGIGR